jgi:hypothetical protein
LLLRLGWCYNDEESSSYSSVFFFPVSPGIFYFFIKQPSPNVSSTLPPFVYFCKFFSLHDQSADKFSALRHYRIA